MYLLKRQPLPFKVNLDYYVTLIKYVFIMYVILFSKKQDGTPRKTLSNKKKKSQKSEGKW